MAEAPTQRRLLKTEIDRLLATGYLACLIDNFGHISFHETGKGSPPYIEVRIDQLSEIRDINFVKDYFGGRINVKNGEAIDWSVKGPRAYEVLNLVMPCLHGYCLDRAKLAVGQYYRVLTGTDVGVGAGVATNGEEYDISGKGR